MGGCFESSNQRVWSAAMSEPCFPRRSEEPGSAERTRPQPAVYSMVPPDQPTAGPEPIYTGQASLLDVEDESAQGRQCSLAELLTLVTLAAVGLSLLSLIPGGLEAPRAAGIAGVAALMGLVLLCIFRPRRFIVHLAWWVLVGAYVIACVVAVVRWG